MSISVVITEGYGSFGTIADVIRMGYGSGGAVVVQTPAQSSGGKKYRYFTPLDYRRAEQKVKKLEKEKLKLEKKIEVLQVEVKDTRRELAFAKTMALIERLTKAIKAVQDELNAALARLDEIEREEEQEILWMVREGLID